MSPWLAALCLLALQDPPPAPAPEENAPPAGGQEIGPPLDPAAPESAAPRALDFQAPLGPGGILERFDEIAARFPGSAAVERLAADGGRAIGLLVLGARAGGEPGQRPALLFYGWNEPESNGTALAAAELLLAGPPDGPAARLLARATLYLAPALAPDGVPPDARVIPSCNFPIGWRPETVVPGAGTVPLSAPSARALAAFLQGRGNLSLAVALGEGPCTGPETPELEPEDYRRELGPLQGGEPAEEARLAPMTLCPGTAATFAWAARGIFPASVSTPPLLDPLDRALSLLRARALLRAAEALPSLALGEPALEVLRPGQVRIDVRLENRGRLPTLSCVGKQRGLGDALQLTVGGGRVLACAAGAAPEALHVCSATAPGGACYALGEISGGGALQLSLFVEAQPGSELTLSCSAPRAGTAERKLLVP